MPIVATAFAKQNGFEDLLSDGHLVHDGRSSGRIRYSLRSSELQLIRSLRGKQFPYPPVNGDTSEWRRKLNSYLCSKGLKYLNKTRAEDRNVEAVAGALDVLVRMNIADRIYVDQEKGYRRRGGIGDGDLDSLCFSAAKFAMQKWSASYIASQKVNGREGGRKSKRPKDFSVDLYATVAHLANDRERANALGCSQKTVQRMRAALQNF